MFAAVCECRGLLGLGGEESDTLVSGVSPLARDALRFCAKLCEWALKTVDAVLACELAEPTPRSVSPESEGAASSESGER
jgi:hypothetical protein